KLSCRVPAEVLLPEAEVAQLDTDTDGALSRTELRRFADLPPNAELPFVLGRGSMGRARGTADAEYRLRRKLDGGYKLAIGSSEIDLRRNNRDPARSDDAPRFRDFDADSSGELDATEAAMIPGAPAFALVDVDGNGKITSREFDDFFERRANAAAVQLVLEVSDQGYDLFTRLDANFDRVLTPRELHSAARLLETEDADGDGFLGSAEVPYNLLLELSRGGSRANPNVAVVGQRTVTEPRVKVDRKGPAWFLKMDRNNDGDVGLPEFLGDRKTFERLDTDHDGLLSAEEAAAVEKK
ncbi:MAG TPA: hypothetical protein VHB77_11080, partial [Planctomycetaceae bacterium]|nr:hypothetical protein [Planctomycetaceae bacterium]